MSSPQKSALRSTGDTVISFALYFATLFSLDTWAAARASPYRSPGSNTYFRPASNPSEYQAGMHGRGNTGPRGDDSQRGARGPSTLDHRAPIGMGATARCGACMT